MAVELVQPSVGPVVESDASSVVYAIEVGGSGVDRLVRELYRLGCTLIDQRIPGYLVVSLSPVRHAQVLGLRGVAKAFPVAGTDFERPVTIPSPPPSNQVGEMVRVVAGHYRGVSGVIQSASRESLRLEIVLFGRLMTITLPVESVEPIPVPEPWRG
jgi:hypothetical protein